MFRDLKRKCFINFLENDLNPANSMIKYFKCIAKHNAYKMYELEYPHNLTGVVYIARNTQVKNQVKEIKSRMNFHVYPGVAVSLSQAKSKEYRISGHVPCWACGRSFNKLDIIIDDFFNFDEELQEAIYRACCIPNVFVQKELNIYVYSSMKQNSRFFLDENFIEIKD